MNERANEPAYPALESISADGESRYPSGGLTIREHFAGLILPAVIEAECQDPPRAAKYAVEYADALIAALNQEQVK